jgi:hypothetical protein
VEKIPGVKEDEQERGNRTGGPGIAFGPPLRRGTLQGRAERRDALPGTENESGQPE